MCEKVSLTVYAREQIQAAGIDQQQVKQSAIHCEEQAGNYVAFISQGERFIAVKESHDWITVLAGNN